MAKFQIRIQYRDKASTEFETDDEDLASKFLVRSVKEARNGSTGAVAIFSNNKLKWRKR